MTSPIHHSTPDDLDDPRVMQLAREFLEDLEAGRTPNRQAYLARCPERADELEECLEGIELVHEAGRRHRTLLPPPDPMLGTLGDFQIVREIGRGGMGVVYEAIQISLNRMVALKVLPFAAALDERYLQRFRNEAQAAAGLHHNHIIPVYAVGCERGVQFYAMQLIDGRPLDAVIREMRGESGDPILAGVTTEDHVTASPTGLSAPTIVSRTVGGRERFRTAARIASQVADALEYAHQAGVIHRDIKPANLMLDARGCVWVADFGLAQVSDVNLTRTGDVVGTLRYMSPEQASGTRVLIDHRADVYSLGATLYELVTLQPIFPAQNRAALLNQILNEEPRPPRQVDGSIPVDLETIILKAVAKEPADRYASAVEMGSDLERFLNELPIRARRPSLAEHVRKWMRRHPSLVGMALLLLAFSTAVLALAVALVSHEQTRAEKAYAAEQLRAKEAEERFQLAERAVDDLIQVAEEELLDKPHMESLRRRLLESALAYHQEFIELHHRDPDARARLEENRARVAGILRDLIVLQGAGRIFLLKEKVVLDDLKLDEEERQAVEVLSKTLDENRHTVFREFHKLTPKEREGRFLQMARENELAVADLLSPQQVHRLRQIELQKRGPTAFREPDIARSLNLTATQRTRIRAAIADPYGGKPEPTGQPPWIAADRKRKASLELILTLLTAEQRAGWQSMIGEPFTDAPPAPRDFGRMFGPMRDRRGKDKPR